MSQSPFGDDGELDHVMWLLRGWAVGELVSPLRRLELELRRLLAAPSAHEYPLSPGDFETASDIRHLSPSSNRFSNRQSACLDALAEILFATLPGDWDRSRLDKFESLLRKIHGVAGDALRHDVDTGAAAFRLSQRKKAQKPRPTREKVSLSDLDAFKKNWMFNHSSEHGWQAAACRKYGISQAALSKKIKTKT